jgi:multiple sugar transport system substrate-binding protein
MVTEKNIKSKGNKVKKFSRRDFIKAAGAGLAAAGLGAGIMIPGRARAEKRKLRIVNWVHPGGNFDDWFENVYSKEWGEKNNTEVIVKNHP